MYLNKLFLKSTVGVEGMAPKVIQVLIPGACECYLTWQMGLRGQIKLRVLGGIILVGSTWNHRGHREGGGVMVEAEPGVAAGRWGSGFSHGASKRNQPCGLFDFSP